MLGNQWFRKESPLLSLIGLGGGGLTAGSSETGISATGGQTTTYTSQGVQYKAHKFTSSGSFAVSSLGSLGGDTYFAVVAGGGGGAGRWCPSVAISARRPCAPTPRASRGECNIDLAIVRAADGPPPPLW